MNTDKSNWYRHTAGSPAGEYLPTRAIMPHTCLLSGRTIYPLQQAWRRQYFQYYNNQVAFEHWISANEMLIAKLKGKEL